MPRSSKATQSRCIWSRLRRIAGSMTAAMLLSTPPRPAVGINLPAVEDAALAYRNPNAQLEQIYRNALLDAEQHSSLTADGSVYVSTGDIPA